MFYWIHIYDPNNENLQVFTLIEATAILKNQKAKDYYQYVQNASGNSYVYGAPANAIVLEPATTENFYQNSMDYCALVNTYAPTYADFRFPQISNFETIESFDIDDIYTPVALDNKLLHASFDNPLTMEKGEGLFTAAVTQGLVMSSQNQGNILKSASYVNQIMQETSNIITEGWNARQKSYDVISQKYSDATLGYERVREINDPERIYRAYNGFMDSEFSEGFELVNNDNYSKEVSGYIVNGSTSQLPCVSKKHRRRY